MSKQSVTQIGVGMVVVPLLGFTTMTLMKGPTLSTALQANSSQNPAAQEEKPFDQKLAIADLRKKIAGQEEKPSEEVFKNIQIPLFKKLPAKLIPPAMELVFSRSLGVDCKHCHVVDQWEQDDKPTKQIARDMYALMLSIDGDLKKISNLKSKNPIVTCYSCHRGQTKPELGPSEPKKMQ
jgi:hypothetical protein